MLFFRPFLRTTPNPVSTLSSSLRKSAVYRTMASTSAAPLQEWLVIVPDHSGALQKRLAARPKHVAGLKADRDDMWLWGGAMLEEPIEEGDTNPPKMTGSACLIGAKTREEVVERLKNDVYVKEGVWNLDEVKIIPFKSAVRKAL
ncbi:hypothetical protein PTNB85_06211 [Pyrenophora teres f. teres]|nr:hypothetical protein PTNB85_06211 [Pyrenophora teres f. teres]KAE8861166.1 hypothetical protein PTNB29_06261 [Pyrenophora teres f. teres]CAE7193574.1 YCII domain containing protein [Pyrenophora teres f. teres]